MFTKKELEKLKSCWLLPSGEIYSVSAESHDLYLPDEYEKKYEDVEHYDILGIVEKECIRMSFYWGWDADCSYMKIGCNKLTDNQKQIIKFLLNAEIIKKRSIQVISRTLTKGELLQEVLAE